LLMFSTCPLFLSLHELVWWGLKIQDNL
jgi:hypothetical protein